MSQQLHQKWVILSFQQFHRSPRIQSLCLFLGQVLIPESITRIQGVWCSDRPGTHLMTTCETRAGVSATCTTWNKSSIGILHQGKSKCWYQKKSKWMVGRRNDKWPFWIHLNHWLAVCLNLEHRYKSALKTTHANIVSLLHIVYK